LSATEAKTRATRVLVISRGAGSMTQEIEAKLRLAFADHLVIDFDPEADIEDLFTAQARIVVAGGDGTVEFMLRKLADSKHPIGVLPLGTFNNFARALGLPEKLDAAIAVAKKGHARAITLGRVNGHVFVEACAIGLFGETLALGDSAKDMEFGALVGKLKDVIAAKRFHYELAGDLQGSGTAMSLVFSNSSSIGTQMRISDSTPTDAYLEFSVHAGRSRTDIVGRAIISALHRQESGDGIDQVFRFRKLEVKTKPRVRVYADNLQVGRTPATITAELSAVKVLMPK
jgi:diacylglycerol kinase (ATP)